MRGIRLKINGKVVCVAAVPGLHQLQSTVVMGGSFGEPQISVNGYIQHATESEHLEWGKQQLKVGDTVTMELIDTDKSDQPLKAETIDSSQDMEEMNKRIEEQMARLRLEIELNGKEAVIPTPKGTYCSFCGKEKGEVTQMISGPGPATFICNECVAICNDILSGKHKRPEEGQWPERDA